MASDGSRAVAQQQYATFQIKYIPHVNTLTKSGQAHFTNIKDAMAELIDNAIQAVNENTEDQGRRIRVVFARGGGGGGHGNGHLIIHDNGKGMDRKGLEEFATYFFGVEDRGLESQAGTGRPEDRAQESARSGFISKFGVGAFNAGFYIGDRFTVVTRHRDAPGAEASPNQAQSVLQFTIDEEELKRRQADATSVAFLDNAYERPPMFMSNSPHSGVDEVDAVVQDVVAKLDLEPNSGSFTYLALRLRAEHHDTFNKERLERLTRQLAHTYHYFLHPDDILLQHQQNLFRSVAIPPAVDISVYCAKSLSGGGGMSQHVSQASTAAASGSPWRLECPLKNVRDLERQYIEQGKMVQHFKATVSLKGEDGKLVPHTAHGILRYYPHNGSGETLPRRSYKDDGDDSDDSDEEGAATSDVEAQKGVVFDVFWQNRLVPGTTVAGLPFFPSKKMQTTHREKISPKWESRIHGSLFFYRDFPITMNKLFLKVSRGGEGNLQTILTRKPEGEFIEGTSYSPRTFDKDFLKFLTLCREKLDKDCTFVHANPEITELIRKLDQDPSVVAFTEMRFGQATGTNAENVFQQGDILRIAKKGRKTVLGQILCFTSNLDGPSDPQNANFHTITCMGHGKVCIRRLPEELWGTRTIVWLDAMAIETNKSRLSMPQFEEEATKIMHKVLPTTITVKSKVDGSDGPEVELADEEATTTVAGKSKLGLEINIFNANGAPAEKALDDQRWRIRKSITGPEDEGTPDPITSDAPYRNSTSYWFNPMDLRCAGEYAIQLDVLRPEFSVSPHDELLDLLNDHEEPGHGCDDPVVVFKHRVVVEAGAPTSMEVTWASETMRREFQLGAWLPNLRMCMRDAFGNVVDHTNALSPSIGSLSQLSQGPTQLRGFAGAMEPTLSVEGHVMTLLSRDGASSTSATSASASATSANTVTACWMSTGEDGVYEWGHPKGGWVIEGASGSSSSSSSSSRSAVARGIGPEGLDTTIDVALNDLQKSLSVILLPGKPAKVGLLTSEDGPAASDGLDPISVLDRGTVSLWVEALDEWDNLTVPRSTTLTSTGKRSKSRKNAASASWTVTLVCPDEATFGDGERELQTRITRDAHVAAFEHIKLCIVDEAVWRDCDPENMVTALNLVASIEAGSSGQDVTLEVPLSVSASTAPCSLAFLYNGAPYDASTHEAFAMGTDVSGFEFTLQNAQGEESNMAEIKAQCVAYRKAHRDDENFYGIRYTPNAADEESRPHLELHWGKRTTVTARGTCSVVLLSMPKGVEDEDNRTYRVKIECVFPPSLGLEDLTGFLEVPLKPGEPGHWRMEIVPNPGIMAGQLISEIFPAVTLADQSKKVAIRDPAVLRHYEPTMFLETEHGAEQAISLHLDEESGRWLVHASAVCEAHEGKRKIKVQSRNEGDGIASHGKKVQVIPSPPAAIQIMSAEMGAPEWGESLQLQPITSGVTVPGLWVRLLNCLGHPVALQGNQTIELTATQSLNPGGGMRSPAKGASRNHNHPMTFTFSKEQHQAVPTPSPPNSQGAANAVRAASSSSSSRRSRTAPAATATPTLNGSAPGFLLDDLHLSLQGDDSRTVYLAVSGILRMDDKIMPLRPAKLACTVEPLNMVNQVEATFVGGPDLELVSDAADMTPLDVIVHLRTSNGSIHVPNEVDLKSCITVTTASAAKRGGSKRGRVESTTAYGRPYLRQLEAGEGDFVVYVPADPGAFRATGKRTVTVQYQEIREAMLEAMGEDASGASVAAAPLGASIVSGAPHTLQPKKPADFAQLIVCDDGQGGEDNPQLILGKKLALQVLDANNNVCTDGADLEAFCQLVPLDVDEGGGGGGGGGGEGGDGDEEMPAIQESETQLPSLRNQDAEGRVAGTVKATSSGTEISFDRVAVQQGSVVMNGACRVVFTCARGEGEVLAQFQADLRYESNSAQMAEINELKAQFEALVAQREAAQRQLEELQAPLEDARGEWRGLMDQLPSDCASVLTAYAPEDPEVGEVIDNLTRTRAQEKETIESHVTRGAMVDDSAEEYVQNLPPDIAQAPHIVDVLFMEDRGEAELVSWALAGKLEARVVNTDEHAALCCARGVKSVSMASLPMFTCKPRNERARRRTQAEIRDKELPLGEAMKDSEGAVEYVANLIQLDSGSEGLRDTLVWALVGRMVLFERTQDMEKYRRDKRFNHHVLLAKDTGRVVHADGILVPDTLEAARQRSELRFVLGELRGTQMPGYQGLAEQIATLTRLREIHGEVAQVRAEGADAGLGKLEATCQDLDAQIGEIEARIEELAPAPSSSKKRRRGAAGGGGGGRTKKRG